MKTQLTKEQSQQLIDLGVPKEKASAKEIIKPGEFVARDNLGNTITRIPETTPIFRFTDLLEILPKEIERDYITYTLCISYGCDIPGSNHDTWFAYYDELDDLEPAYAEELIDVLYELCIKCLENKYI